VDFLARFRSVVRIRVAPEWVRYDHRDTSVAWPGTICLDPRSTKIYNVGVDSCAEPDGVFIRIFDRGGPSTEQRLREIGLDRFFAYGALLSHESLLIRRFAEVSGLTSFERRDREELRASYRSGAAQARSQDQERVLPGLNR
jgi:hypothetical protein